MWGLDANKALELRPCSQLQASSVSSAGTPAGGLHAPIAEAGIVCDNR